MSTASEDGCRVAVNKITPTFNTLESSATSQIPNTHCAYITPAYVNKGNNSYYVIGS